MAQANIIMVDTYFDITPYLSAIARDQLIITANNRLRNHMLRAYGQLFARQRTRPDNYCGHVSRPANTALSCEGTLVKNVLRGTEPR